MGSEMCIRDRVCAMHYPSDVAAGEAIGRQVAGRAVADPAFQAEIESRFEGDYTVHYHLAPPMLPTGTDTRGRPLKRSFGPWMGRGMKALARMKRLRGTILDLTYKEFELLKFLAANRGRVLTRDALLHEVWGEDYIGGSRTVDVHIRRLRAKLGTEHDNLIGTVRNVGYRLDAPEDA